MSDELIQVLRGAIREELDPIVNKLNRIDDSLSELKSEMHLVKRAALETADTVSRIESTQERH